jgi:hypothetical protein
MADLTKERADLQVIAGQVQELKNRNQELEAEMNSHITLMKDQVQLLAQERVSAAILPLHLLIDDSD